MQGRDDIRAQRERYALIGLLETKIKGAWHAVGCGLDNVLVKDDTNARHRCQSLAAGTRGQVNTAEING